MLNKLDSEQFLMLTEASTVAVSEAMAQYGLQHLAKDPSMIAMLMASSLGRLIGETTQQSKETREELLKNMTRLMQEAIATADVLREDPEHKADI